MPRNSDLAYGELAGKTKRRAASAILEGIEAALPLESACWAAGVDPVEFEDAMQTDRKLRRGVMRQFAATERRLIQYMLEQGEGAGLTRGKAALEILSRCFKAWSNKTTVSLQARFEVALDELERKLDRNTYRTVLQVLSKH